MIKKLWKCCSVLFYKPNFNAPETKFMSEKNSEYHRYNIENYPKVKKYMKNS